MNAVIELNPIRLMVDEFAELHNRLAPELDRYEALKKQLSEIANSDASDAPFTIDGYEYSVDYSAPAATLKCLLSPQALVKKTKAWDALSVSVTNARKVLTEDQLEAYFAREKGSRRFRRVR